MRILRASPYNLYATTGALVGDDTTPPGGMVVKLRSHDW